MKAVQMHGYGGIDQLRYEDVPDPKPGPGQVVVGVRAVGVNPVDTYIRGGRNPALPRPYTPGSDAAGKAAAAPGCGRRGCRCLRD